MEARLVGLRCRGKWTVRTNCTYAWPKASRPEGGHRQGHRREHCRAVPRDESELPASQPSFTIVTTIESPHYHPQRSALSRSAETYRGATALPRTGTFSIASTSTAVAYPPFTTASKEKAPWCWPLRMTTMGRRLMANSPFYLQIFGAFVNEPFRPNPSYYGTGEWFVLPPLSDPVLPSQLTRNPPHTPAHLRLNPSFLWKALLSDRPEDAQVRVYPWTGRNDYILLCDSGFIGIGGGDGKFGLWLHSDLERGHSERCVTFDNELLSSSSEFECVQLEVWGFKI
ncbi:TLD-domain-containing protein [Jimgerdemannia flammicorona]|uniref:Oxidation resistance protein 1 n=1 Tax=Jimgerdemannia flammicorona TaxID=994334 RepID=A0A433Q1E5_9FUNG|nr:TLD-domain-containing protein [Jimgerdemannia flammicorona]